MKAIRFGLRALVRDARSGELVILASALIVAVASVTAIGFLTDRIGQAVALQAAEVLAADIRLTSPQPLDPSRVEQAKALNLKTATTVSFPSVIFLGDDSVLAAINAVSDGYPLRGTVRTAHELLAEPTTATSIPSPGDVWMDTAVMARLGATVGDTIDLGQSQLQVTAVLTYRPDQTPGFAGLAPVVLMNIDDIPATGLIAQGSRVRYAQLYAGERRNIARFVDNLGDTLPKQVRLEDRGNAGRELNDAIARASRFLALASLVSLLLAAVAVAMTARRYAHRRLDSAALMKSLGASKRLVIISSLTQIAIIGVVASLLGAALGYIAENVLTLVLADWLRSDLPAASLKPVVMGFGTALILLAGFALPSVLQVANTPPLRVLRRDLSPPPPSVWFTYSIAIGSLSALIYWSVRDFTLLAVIMGGSLLTGALLYIVGRLLVVLLAKRRGSVGVAWRYGLANIARRGTDSAVQIVAFGLGLMVLLVLSIVRQDLLSGWRATLDVNAPNHFLINIQPEERDSIRQIITQAELPTPEFVPLVRARMVDVNSTKVDQRDYTNDRGRRLAVRDANLTYSSTLSDTNTLTQGEWWPEDYAGPALVSVEVDAAESMGIELGDELTFDVAGESLTAIVSSVREVKWDSFKPNFFMVFSPNALRESPQTYVTSLKVANEKRGALLTLVRAHPSVSIIDLEAVLNQVRSIIDKAALAVQSVFLFTLLAGLVVLFAAVQSTLDERKYESALLRTFGASRATVFAGLATEFAALGFAAGLFAAIGATVVGSLAARKLFDMSYQIDPMLWLVGSLTGVLVVGLSGVLAARSAVDTPPVVTLRHN